MNWYKFNISEYQLETYGIPDAEDLAYRRLMDRYYQEEGPLINDEHDLCASIGLDWDCIIPVLQRYFLLNEGNQWVHPDWQRDINSRQEKAFRMAQIGRANRKGLPDQQE